MPVARIGGMPLHYHDTGGEGPAVLFSHGFLLDHEQFAPQVAALEADHRCVAVDARGFGGTPADAPFTYDDLAADCLGLLDHLGIDQAVWVGLSQGGFVGLRAALVAPERVRALVLINTQAGVDDAATIAAYRGLHDEWMARGPGAIREGLADLLLGVGVDRAPWFTKWEDLEPAGLSHAFECLVDRSDLTGRLGEVHCPAIVLHGDQDRAIPVDRAEALCRALPGCDELVLVPGAAHAASLSHPELVEGPLRALLDRVERPH
jgi:3-oxoadipate enol-lactonase